MEFSFRVISDRWRDTPLSAIGAFQRGGRYNAPETFLVLYTADSQMTALLEAALHDCLWSVACDSP